MSTAQKSNAWSHRQEEQQGLCSWSCAALILWMIGLVSTGYSRVDEQVIAGVNVLPTGHGHAQHGGQVLP